MDFVRNGYTPEMIPVNGGLSGEGEVVNLKFFIMTNKLVRKYLHFKKFYIEIRIVNISRFG